MKLYLITISSAIYWCFCQVKLQGNMFRTECGHRQASLLRKSKLHLHIKLRVVRLRFQSLVMTLHMLLVNVNS